MTEKSPLSRQPTARSAALRERLLLEHFPRVRLIAGRIHERLTGSASLADLISAGMRGLIDAIDQFDDSRKVTLKIYAEYRIRGAMLEGLRDLDGSPRERLSSSRTGSPVLSFPPPSTLVPRLRKRRAKLWVRKPDGSAFRAMAPSELSGFGGTPGRDSNRTATGTL